MAKPSGSVKGAAKTCLPQTRHEAELAVIVVRSWRGFRGGWIRNEVIKENKRANDLS